MQQRETALLSNSIPAALEIQQLEPGMAAIPQTKKKQTVSQQTNTAAEQFRTNNHTVTKTAECSQQKQTELNDFNENSERTSSKYNYQTQPKLRND